MKARDIALAGVVAGAVGGLLGVSVGLFNDGDKAAAAQVAATLVGLLGAGVIARWQTARQLDSVGDQIAAASKDTAAANRAQMDAVTLQVSAAAELSVASQHYTETLGAAGRILESLGVVANAMAAISTEWMRRISSDDVRSKHGHAAWFDQAEWDAKSEELRSLCLKVLVAFDHWRLVGGSDAIHQQGRAVHDGAWDAADKTLEAATDLARDAYDGWDDLKMMEQLSLRTQAAAQAFGNVRQGVADALNADFDAQRAHLDTLRRETPQA